MRCLSRTVVGLPTAVLIIGASPALADQAAVRGLSLLTEHCAQCHALGRTGNSTLPSAPPFRRIGERMDMDELMMRMQEGLSSGHRAMPLFRFSREDRRAIRSYLNTIQD